VNGPTVRRCRAQRDARVICNTSAGIQTCAQLLGIDLNAFSDRADLRAFLLTLDSVAGAAWSPRRGYDAGRMLWLRWKRFAGSYCRFTAARRS
jgi:hypothetical protein